MSGVANIDMILHFLAIFIFAFINEGSSSLSNAFLDEPWSWGLMLPLSIYIKIVLELHCLLGIFLGVGIPALAYWLIRSRDPIEWWVRLFCSSCPTKSEAYLVQNSLMERPNWLMSSKKTMLLLLQLVGVFFYSGNVLLLSWGFTGMEYSAEVGQAISWVSLGSVMSMWQKACLDAVQVTAITEKPHSSSKDQRLEQP